MAATAPACWGDATLEKVGAIDFESKCYMLAPAAELARQIRERVDPEGDEKEMLIALTEFITFVAMAARA